MSREDDLIRFYRLLAHLEDALGGKRCLSDCHGRLGWPDRGVYFFFESGKTRSDTGSGDRVVRVGTHALTAESGTSLWNRLSQHRGTNGGNGNHRGSIFRLLVGTALKGRQGTVEPRSWGLKTDITKAALEMQAPVATLRRQEEPLEIFVSEYIGRMPFLWLAVEDTPGQAGARGVIERNSIALLSNHGKVPLDSPSPDWLGHYCDRERVRQSGLWNNNHVEESYDPGFLDAIEGYVERCRRSATG